MLQCDAKPATFLSHTKRGVHYHLYQKSTHSTLLLSKVIT